MKSIFQFVLFFGVQSTFAIIGGEIVDPSSGIAHQTVLFTVRGSNGKSGCTATILDDSHALTAAHCLLGFGSDNAVLIFATSFSASALSRKVTKAIAYSEAFGSDDIAVLTFSGGLPQGYEPVVLAMKSRPTAGRAVVMAGYGATDGVGAGNGRGVLRSVVTTINSVDANEKVLFAGKSGQTACNGDSGGPDFISVGDKLVLVGVHSESSPNCDSLVRSTDVSHYIVWIQSLGVQPRHD